MNKVGIIGAGTMGAGIAAHLANADVPVVLLDIVTPHLSDDEKANPEARNRHVQAAFKRMATGRPVQLARPDRAELITLGNIEDDFDLLAECDWVVEVIIERLQPKRALMARLEATCKPTAIVSSNTSGIPIAEIVAECGEDFRRRFLGTHFFNPPRYLKLLEIIPTDETSDEVVARMRDFGRSRLGKGIVLCKDTPNFIANRFGAITGSFIAETALSNGYSVAEVDMLLGPLIGRPKTGYFRLADLVGLDIRANVINNLYPVVPHDKYRELLKGQTFWPVFDRMMENGWLGNKSGQGFIKKTMVDGKREFWTLDPATFEYAPPKITTYPSVEAAQAIRDLPERIRYLLNADDRGAWLVQRVIFNMLEYAAYVAPEIAYSLEDVDNAVRWGFNYEMGPFELWDALGVAEIAGMMENAGHHVADWVRAMLASGNERFYRDGMVYDFVGGEYRPKTTDPDHLTITSFTPIETNESATIHDMGDRVLLLEFHGKANAIDDAIFAMGRRALELLESQYAALVIGNEGRHFSAGARMKTQPTPSKEEGQSPLVSESEFAQTEQWIQQGQAFMLALHQAKKPVVAAVHGFALGGGAELAMHCWRSVAAFDARMGLVEFNVGLVPGWGGTKELLRRRVNPVARVVPEKVLPILRELLAQLMSAQISDNAWEARTLGHLCAEDVIVMNADHRLAKAKEIALTETSTFEQMESLEEIYAAGRGAREVLDAELNAREAKGEISAFDGVIGRKLTHILCGDVDEPTWVDPQHILDLARSASLDIRFRPESRARMAHMLKTGRPLRN